MADTWFRESHVTCKINRSYLSNISDTQSRREITSGSLYEDVISICPDATIYDSQNTLQISIDKIDMTDGGDAAALLFIKTAARILSCESISKYKNAVIGHFDTDGLITISISEYKNPSNFITSLSTNFDDSTFNDSVQNYYDDILGHFDQEYYLQILEYSLKESSGVEANEPETVYADKYLLFGSIPHNLHFYETKNSTMYIHLEKLDASEKGGALFGKYASKFIKTFALLPNSYSFDSFEFVCVGENDQLLGTIAFYINDSNSLAICNKIFYCSDFFQGFKAAFDV